jgi:ABC-type glycerol-3-phosphate transport system substrate-binding protein
VRIQAPAFAEAFRWFARTAKYRPAQPGDPTAAVVSGSAVAAVVPVGELAKLPKDPATGAVDARFGIGPVPGSDEYFDDAGGRQKSIGLNRIPHYPGGGLVGVVRKSATHPDAAWSLLAELGGPQGSAATLNTPAVGGGPVRVDHTSENTRAWQQYGFDQARTADLSRAVWEYVASGTLNPALGLRTPDVDAIHTLLARTLAKVATGELTADAGHQLAVKEWKEHDDKTPREQRLNARQKAAGVD